MIDINEEQFISLNGLRDMIFRMTGRKIAPSTVYNWVHRGVNGRKLDVVRMGGRIYTSGDSVRRWFGGRESDGHPVTESHSLEAREAWRVFG